MCHAAEGSVLGDWATIARVVFSFVHKVEFASEVFYVRFAKRSENLQKFFSRPGLRSPSNTTVPLHVRNRSKRMSGDRVAAAGKGEFVPTGKY